jgi:hypothetical protein
MQRATFIFIGLALALLFVIIIEQIFVVEQYVHRDVMNFFTYSTMNVLASWTFLNSFTNKGYKYASIDFLKA